MTEEQSIAEIKTFICIFLLALYSLIEFTEEYVHLDATVARQPIYATAVYPLPNHGNDRGSQYERTVGTSIAVGTIPYKPEGLEWLRRDDYQPRQALDLTYLYPSSGTVFQS